MATATTHGTSKVLPQSSVEQYFRDGYVFPLSVLDAEEVAALRGRLEAFEAEQGGALHPAQRSKTHLLFKWLDDFIRDPRVLDPIEDLIGPDILCWTTHWFIKEANSPQYVSWHQDSNYWGLDTDELVSVWLAVSESTVQSGCLRLLPGSHFPPQERARGSRLH